MPFEETTDEAIAKLKKSDYADQAAMVEAKRDKLKASQNSQVVGNASAATIQQYQKY